MQKIEEKDWKTLLSRIKDGKCTPFLGAGVNHGVLPLGTEVAKKWSKEYKYPLDDTHDLAHVAEYLAITQDKMLPKELFLQELEEAEIPDAVANGDPYGILAELPLPIYLTTNYDDLMVRALKSCKKDPRRELCVWNSYLKDKVKTSVFSPTSSFQPTAANPVVFHLHGHNGISESLVLTEGDYLDFLVYVSKHQDSLPPRIQEALTGASLLFVGYSMNDWDFKVIFRGLVTAMESSLRRLSIAVQIPPNAKGKAQADALKYLANYFSRNMEIRIYWGTAKEFANELRNRWEAFDK